MKTKKIKDEEKFGLFKCKRKKVSKKRRVFLFSFGPFSIMIAIASLLTNNINLGIISIFMISVALIFGE